MSNYTQNVSYGPKDALTTGDAAKRIKGVEIDAEFAEIATAISSKEDTANKGAANGYCGLDASGLIDASDLPATAALTNAINTFSSGMNISGATPYLNFVETGVTADNTTWRLIADGENFYGYVMADNLGSGSQWMAITRTGITIDSLAFAATAIALTGNLTITGNANQNGYALLTTASALVADNITSGTLPNARIAVTGVTQHQASLSIAETQIADGSVFPRIGSSETITGSWTFNGLNATVTGTLVKSGKGAYPYFNSATQSSGAITVSTAAASGTPAAGDLWIQYTA